MVILLILAIVFAMLVGLKFLEGISLSLIIYAVLAVVCLIIYLIFFSDYLKSDKKKAKPSDDPDPSEEA